MRINERLLGYRIRYPFLFLDYLFWLIFDFSKFRRIKKESIKKVLVIHTGAIGELVMITPIIRELKKQFNCKIDCLIKSGMFDLFKDNPNIGNLLPYSNNFNEMLMAVKKEKYDLAVIFQASFKNALLCYRAGIKYRIGGFSRIKRFPAFLYTRRTFPIGLMHSLDYSFGIVSKVGIEPVNKRTEIYLSSANEKKVKSLLKSLKISNYAVIHPSFGPIGKKSPPRIWQNEKYSQIADYLFKINKLSVVFTGLKDQKDTIDRIIANCKNKSKMFNFAGKTNLQELCALIKNSKFVLAPDTGATHIAASFGVPLVNLMDAPSGEWEPIGKIDNIINLHHPREIIFFEKGKLFGKEGGVASIQIKEVIEAIEELI